MLNRADLFFASSLLLSGHISEASFNTLIMWIIKKSSLDHSELRNPWALFEALKLWVINIINNLPVIFLKSNVFCKKSTKKQTGKYEIIWSSNWKIKLVTEATNNVIQFVLVANAFTKYKLTTNLVLKKILLQGVHRFL